MKTICKRILLPLNVLLLASGTCLSQVKFGENKTTINAGSLLELESSASPYKAVLLPRISISTTTTWSLNGSDVAGMMLYNSNAGITSSNTSYPILPGGTGMYYWDGTGWLGMTAPKGTANGQYWSLTGNTGTTASTSAIGTTVNNNFIGSTDAKDVALATNNLERMRITSGGNIGIGTNVPQELLQVGNATSGTNSPGILLQSSANVNGQGGIIRFREISYPSSNWGMEIRHNTDAAGAAHEGLYFDRVLNGLTTNTMIIDQSSGYIGIGITAPAARLDNAGTFKLGVTGTVNKNEINFSGTVSGTAIAAGTVSAAGTDVTITIPIASRPTTTQAIVTVSPTADLPTPVSIGSAYLTSTSVVKVRFVNASNTAQTLASSTFYVNIKEF